MSESESESGEDRPRREVAWRLFAAEFDDADYQYAESDEERAPNYVVTPTGARVNRLFVVGVLTSVEQVNDDVVRARVVDPTGAFVVYAGQYQPDALASLENADVPSFVAVTGKARTFSPEDSEQVYTSIRPESVNAVTPDTRDRWVVTTAERTLARVSTFADALELPERGDDLTAALAERDVPYGLASGISHAIDHYGTTPAYLAAVRELALDASRVVAEEKDEVAELALAPGEGDGTDVDLSYAGAELADVEGAEASMDEHVEATPEGETVTDEPDPSPDDFDVEETAASETAEAEPGASAAATEAAGDADVESAHTESTGERETATDERAPSPDDFESDAGETAEDESTGAESAAGAAETARTEATPEGETVTDEADPSPDDFDADTDADEEWEMDEETRSEVEEEFDVGFSTGSEIPESGESDLAADAEESDADSGEASESDSDLGDFEAGGGFEDTDEDEEPETVEEFTEEEYDEPASEAEDAESPPPDLDLEDVVVDYMDDLDDGDGANRDELVRTVMEETDADEDAIADAIQSALMSGRCYESGDDHLKAI